MPRSQSGKKRDIICPDALTKAVKEAKCGMNSLRKVAAKYNIPKSTIFKYMQMHKSTNLDQTTIELLKCDVRRVFDKDEELQLYEYFKEAAYLYMGLTTKQARDLAYQFAVAKEKTNVPESWKKNKCAGIGWLRYFRQRFPILSLRKPEPTSLARAS